MVEEAGTTGDTLVPRARQGTWRGLGSTEGRTSKEGSDWLSPGKQTNQQLEDVIALTG